MFTLVMDGLQSHKLGTRNIVQCQKIDAGNDRVFFFVIVILSDLLIWMNKIDILLDDVEC